MATLRTGQKRDTTEYEIPVRGYIQLQVAHTYLRLRILSDIGKHKQGSPQYTVTQGHEGIVLRTVTDTFPTKRPLRERFWYQLDKL